MMTSEIEATQGCVKDDVFVELIFVLVDSLFWAYHLAMLVCVGPIEALEMTCLHLRRNFDLQW
jgi:hypothetical protein